MTPTPPERANRLVVLRHAKSAWPDGVPDTDRPLAPRGRRDAPAAGRWLRDATGVPERVVVSPARRTRETWDLASRELPGAPAPSFDPRIYGADAAELLAVLRETPDEVRSVLLVGHSPGVSDLTLELAAGAASATGDALDRVRTKFPTSGIAVLEFPAPWSALAPGRVRLTDFAVPRGVKR